MKTMNFLLAITLLFMVGSCSKDAPAENEDLASVDYRSRINQNEQEETQEVFEIDLRQSYVLGQIAMLNQQKRELEEEIEGGNEKYIPMLESVMEQLKMNTEIFGGILEDTCHHLNIIKRALQIKAIGGDKSAKEELARVNKKLENCGEDAESIGEIEQVNDHAFFVKRPDEIDVCIPDRDEFSCAAKFNSGFILINRLELDERRSQIYFKTTEGEVISEGENLGSHSELDGVEQIRLELGEVKMGILEFTDNRGSLRQPVQLQ